MDYEGGYKGYERSFSDVDVLKHHIIKMCEIIKLLNQIHDLQSHLGDYKYIKREVNLSKLL